jgi:hypothetical protein
VAEINDQLILKRAKELCNEAGIAWDCFDTATPGARVLDAAGRRECLMRARQQLINEIGHAVSEGFEEGPKEVAGAVTAAADSPHLIDTTTFPFASHSRQRRLDAVTLVAMRSLGLACNPRSRGMRTLHSSRRAAHRQLLFLKVPMGIQ